MDTSTPLRPPCRPRPALRITAAAATCLALAYGVARTLDSVVDLANLAMVFVLASTLVAFWLPVWASALFTVAGVGLFNWAFVPPRGSFSVEGHQNLLLLGTLLGVSLSIGLLMGRLRRQVALAQRRTEEAHQLQHLGEALRAADDPQTMGAALHAVLHRMSSGGAALMVLQGERPALDTPAAAWWWGHPDADETPGLWLCLREGHTFGAGTGRHSELPAWYLPVRGPQSGLAAAAVWGAAVLRLDPHVGTPDGHGHTQALCDLLGSALHRHHLTLRTELAQREAQTQSLRSALLAAISHDFRTPLASILGAASSLECQADRLPDTRRRALLTQIQDETRALTAMADNTLQLVRLEAGEVELRRDWESLEELVGAVLARVRRRDPQRRVRARLAPDLPLVRVDALLVTQLLENLVDNALKYTDGPVELLARRIEHELQLAVRDRGAGIAPSERERIFQMFQRGADTGSRRGTGLGLAVCRAIAEAHGGVLRVRARGHGGSNFELRLPLPDAPTLAEPAVESTP